MPTLGKMELTIKINEFPADVKTVDNGWKEFELDCEGQLVKVTVKPKVCEVLRLTSLKPELQDHKPLFPVSFAVATLGTLPKEDVRNSIR
jgi:hypothetical protein